MPFYGGSVAGGYAQGLQANQQAAVRDAQLKEYLQQLAQQKTLYDQQQALRMRQKSAEMEVGPRVRDWALSQQPQVQPPGPGQSSPGGTPNGGPPPQVQQQLQAPPPGHADQAMQMGANPGAPIGPPPAPAPQAGVPPQPDSWKGMPKPPPGAPLGASSYYQMAPIESPPKDQAAAMRTDSGMIPISNKLLVDMAKDWKAKGLNGQQIMDQYKIIAPMLNSEQKQELAQMRYALDIQTKVNAYQEKLVADAQRGRSVAAAEGNLAERQRHDLAIENRPRGGAGGVGKAGKGPNMGNYNQFTAQEERMLKPIEDGTRQGQEIRGLIASNDPAAMAQVQKILTQYIQQGRMTNQLYGDNKSFGIVYERAANAISRFATGDYSDQNKKYILNMLNSMDNKVFKPAYDRLIKLNRDRLTKMGGDPSIADRPLTFGEDNGAQTLGKGQKTMPTFSSQRQFDEAKKAGTIKSGWKFKDPDGVIHEVD